MLAQAMHRCTALTPKRLRQICSTWGAASTRVLLSAATYALHLSHLYLQEGAQD